MTILSIDAGTSSVKAVLASHSTEGGWLVHAQAVASHDPPTPGAAGEMEQDPASWWSSLARAVQELGSTENLEEVEAIGLSGQMQSVILVDGTGIALRPALLYSDTRATAEAAELEASLGESRLREETLNWKGPASVLPKLLWLHRHEPAALQAAAAIHLSAHDYLFMRLAAGGAEAAEIAPLTEEGAPAPPAGPVAQLVEAATAKAKPTWSHPLPTTWRDRQQQQRPGGGGGGGPHVTDATNASTTGLLLAGTAGDGGGGGGWAEALLHDAGLPRWLPRLLPTLAACASAPLCDAAAIAFGCPALAGVPVCAGSGDLGAATVGALGLGLGTAGDAGRVAGGDDDDDDGPTGTGDARTYCYLGTSGWVATTRRASLLRDAAARTAAAPRAFWLRHPSPARCIAAAPMTTAGGNLGWLASTLLGRSSSGGVGGDAFALIDDEAAAAPACCDGLLFLPYLCGERCPVSDPHARACFVGLGLGSTRAHLCRAVLEGICYAVRSLLPLLPSDDDGDGDGDGDDADGDAAAAAAPLPLDMAELAAAIAAARRDGRAQYTYTPPAPPAAPPPPPPPPPLVLVGGVARSRVLPQLLSDILQRRVHVPSAPEHAPALGAAALAAATLGRGGAHAGALPPPPPERVFAPDAALAAAYDHGFECFCRVHPALSETFAQLAKPPAPPPLLADGGADGSVSSDPHVDPQSTLEWLEATISQQ